MGSAFVGDKEYAGGGKSMLIGAAILLMVIVYAVMLSKEVRKKTKRIIFGITTMLVIAPLLSWLLGIGYGVYEGDGFAAMGVMIILFPILFLAGLVILLVGIFKKEVS